MDRSDVVASLNELEDQGLIERTPDPADRRRNVVRCTAAGGRRLTELEVVVTAVNEELLALLPAPDRPRLVDLLLRLTDESAHQGPGSFNTPRRRRTLAAITRLNLMDVEDSAPRFGMEGAEARFARTALGLEHSGLSLFNFDPGFRLPFGHRHGE